MASVEGWLTISGFMWRCRVLENKVVKMKSCLKTCVLCVVFVLCSAAPKKGTFFIICFSVSTVLLILCDCIACDYL